MQIILALSILILSLKAHGVMVRNFPQTITQPKGQVIHCFVSGDEYFSWLHDKDNFTLVQNPKTGYYCYAINQDGELVASSYIVGLDNPVAAGLQPNVQLSMEHISKNGYLSSQDEPDKTDLRPKSGKDESQRTLNNIVIYIRFSDQDEFDAKQVKYTNYFNSTADGANSMINYFLEASYQKLKIISSFYPTNNGNNILSYQDSHTRNYYCPWTLKNDSGYSVSDAGKMMRGRKSKLIGNAIRYIENQLPSTVDLDTDKDGKVDNICFIVRGNWEIPKAPNTTFLWPHSYRWYENSELRLGSKLVVRYNFQIEDYLDYKQNGVLCHEMFHTLGGGDLGRYDSRPVGPWDLMAEPWNPPQSMCADYKYRYGRWIDSIPKITLSGHYVLHPITSASNNCYSIASSKKSEYFIFEFRQKAGTFETSIPGTGLIIYRIDQSECCQNDNPDPTLNWIYIYRPDGTNKSDGKILEANFDALVGRSAFHNSTNPNCLLSDGSLGEIYIKNIQVAGDTVSFDVRFCNLPDEVLVSATSPLPAIANAKKKIETSGPVLIKNTDHVILEAGQQIILNPGFEVQPGGQFETNINSCGKQ
ncbi:MAG TPA: hypothetical protein VGK10_12595 [Prolixibacteraceae bacterium]